MARPKPLCETPPAPPGVTRLLALVGLTALLGGMVAVVVSSRGTDDTKTPATTVALAAARSAPKPTPARPTPVRITVTGIGAYDPEGDRSENGADAPLASDGNARTAWKSERYRSSFRKSGVGLVVDAGRPVRASRVVVTTETPGYNAGIRVGSSPTGPFVAVSKELASGRRTTFALKPRRGRYLMVWITWMPPGGVATVNEIAVTAGG